jgi:ferredoxin-NADP reductase
MKQQNDHFSYHITFEKEHVSSFDYGRITQEYLQGIGVDALYHEADFFICGPAPMMASMKKILRDRQVAPKKIHIEEFSF